MSSAFTSTDGSISLDELTNVTGFDRAQPGVPYSLVKKTAGGVFEPEASSSAVSVDPNGGLEITGGGDLKIKIDATSGDPGLNLNADGLSVIDRVKTAGDTMMGDLEMTGNLVKGLPIDFPPAVAGDAAVSWAQVIAFDAEQSTLKVSKSGDTMSGALNMGGEALENILEPALNAFPDDASTVGYADSETKITGVMEQSATLVITPGGPKTVSISGFTAYFPTLPGRLAFAPTNFILPDSAFIIEQFNTLTCTSTGGFALVQNAVPNPKDQTICRLAILITEPPDVVVVFSISPHMSLTHWDQRLSTTLIGMNLSMVDFVLQTTARSTGSQNSESINYPNQPNNFEDFPSQSPANLTHFENNVPQTPTTDLLPSGVRRYNAGVLQAVGANNWTIMYHLVGNISNTNFIAYTEVEESSVDPLQFTDWESFVIINDPTALQENTMRTIISVKGNFVSETDRIVFTNFGGGTTSCSSECTLKRAITICAERSGSITTGLAQWSFGANAQHGFIGYPMIKSGRVLGLGLSAAAGAAAPTADVTVKMIDDVINDVGSVTALAGSFTGVANIFPAYELSAGRQLQFISLTTNASVTGAIVSALIEIDE